MPLEDRLDQRRLRVDAGLGEDFGERHFCRSLAPYQEEHRVGRPAFGLTLVDNRTAAFCSALLAALGGREVAGCI